jgi:hypothetical protein
MQAGERELGLRLNPDGGQRAAAERAGTFPGATEQRGLADARFSADDERPASLAQSIEDRIKTLDLCVASDEAFTDRTGRHGHGSSINRAMQSVDSSDC